MLPLYLDPGSGGFLIQLLLAGGLTVIGLLISLFKQRLNLVVLIGVLVIAGCVVYLDVIKYPKTFLQNPYAIVEPILGLAILILSFFNWRWRAISWIIFGVLGMADTIQYSINLFNPVLLIMFIGFAIVIGGSVWELNRKNKQSVVAAIPKSGNNNEDEDDDE